MATITLGSPTITEGAQIPLRYKNNSICGEPNISPPFEWTFDQLLPQWISFMTLEVKDITPGAGNFKHWTLFIEIGGGCQQYPFPMAIPENYNYPPCSGTGFQSSDYPSGDHPNGWNGPCASSGTHTYQASLTVFLNPAYNDAAQSKDGIIVSQPFTFTDNPEATNTPPPSEIPTGECGTSGCPPGATLVDGLCQLITSIPVTANPITYDVTNGVDDPSHGVFGMRIYDEVVDVNKLPLRGVVNAYLHYYDGAPAAQYQLSEHPLSPVNPNTVWNNRLKDIGIWSDNALNPLPGEIGNCASGGAAAPCNEWIGISHCLTVSEAKVYCIGFASDNKMRLRINGQLIAHFIEQGEQKHFNYWHVIPVYLNQGANIIELEGLNEGGEANFAAEIYEATVEEIVAVVNQTELDPYIVFTTGEPVDTGTEFTIGENSGYVCPDGTAYDTCTSGNCTSISYTTPALTTCCWIIENCQDSEEVYAINFDAGETEPIYTNSVYALAGNALLVNKCFTVIEQIVCETPDMVNITVTTVHGDSNCGACDPSEKVESCATPGEFVYLALAAGQPALVVGNTYEFDALEGCYNYIGSNEENSPQYSNVTVDTNHGFANCLACIPCAIFRNCGTGEDINIRFDNSVLDYPDPLNVVVLGGDPAFDNTCFQFVGYTEELCTPDYIDVTIASDTECQTCEACRVQYLLTDCTDPSNTIVVDWALTDNGTPLDESQTYIFNAEGVDPLICWSVQSLPPNDCANTKSPGVPKTAGEDETPTVPSVPFTKAQAFTYIEDMDWIQNSNGGGPYTYEIYSLEINGVEQIYPAAAQTYEWTYSEPSIDGLTVLLDNLGGKVYDDQAIGFNAIFAAMGIDDKFKAQTIRNPTHARDINGIYILTTDEVTDYVIRTYDNDGIPRIMTPTFHCMDDSGFPEEPGIGVNDPNWAGKPVDGGSNKCADAPYYNEDPGMKTEPIANPDVKSEYEWMTPISADDVPFVVTNDVVVEPGI